MAKMMEATCACGCGKTYIVSRCQYEKGLRQYFNRKHKKAHLTPFKESAVDPNCLIGKGSVETQMVRCSNCDHVFENGVYYNTYGVSLIRCVFCGHTKQVISERGD